MAVPQRPKASQQKAQRAQMGILARLIGCAYLIYIVIRLIRAVPEDDSLNQTLKLVIAIILMIAAAFVVFITVRDFIKNLRAGYYSLRNFTDDEALNGAAEENAVPEPSEETGIAQVLADADAETEDTREPDCGSEFQADCVPGDDEER